MSSPENWRVIQRQNFTDWKKLTAFLGWDEALCDQILKQPRFPLNLPKRLAEKIAKNTHDDPILRQFLPHLDEEKSDAGFVADPVEDFRFRKERKLIQKYQGRALLLASAACAMNCRFCFRQNFDYETEVKNFDEELRAIREDSSLSEIILSGGDPLSLSDESLQKLLFDLGAIPHIKRIRFHTRFPIGIPERVTDQLLNSFAKTPRQIVFIVHTNHARELDSDIIAALKKIQSLGIPILTHSVLLRDVNDDVQTLKTLFETLADNGFIPYYLNQLDRARGTAHFEVPEARGHELLQELSTLISGYALPRYAREIPGLPSKTLLRPLP